MASSKLHRNPPFRAEHLGSLLRPGELLKKRADLDGSKVEQKQLESLEDTAVKKIIYKPLELGFYAISDGEYRRQMFWGPFFPGMEGFTEIKNPEIDIFPPYMPDIAAFTESGHKPGGNVTCTEKLSISAALIVPKERVHECKITMAAPEWYHMRYKEGLAYPEAVYPSDAEYFADIANAYQTELQILYDDGLRNVQIDDFNLAYFCSEKMLSGWRTHLPRSDLPRVERRHYLEYDTPRAGGFESLKHLPKTKNVILGVITSKFPETEDLEEMKGRVFQAADFVAEGNGESRQEALQRLGVSPKCGFASHSSGNDMQMEDMIQKLNLVRRLADSIWPGEP